MSGEQPTTVRIGDGEPFEVSGLTLVWERQTPDRPAFSWPPPVSATFDFESATLGKVLRAGVRAEGRAASRRQSPGGPGSGVAGISRVWWVWDELLPQPTLSALDGRYRRRQRNRVKRRRR